MPNPLEVLKRAQNLPVDGRLLTIADLMQEFQCSRRQVEMLIETGELAAFKNGKRVLTTQAARDDLVHRRIEERLAELEGRGDEK